MRRPGIFVLVALVVGALTFLIVDRDDPPPATLQTDDLSTDAPEAPVETAIDEPEETEAPEPPPGSDTYRNRAGYSFAYPQEWSLDERRSAVEIRSPDSSVVMSFGVAPDGDVRAAMGAFLDALEERYRVSEVRGPVDAAVGSSQGVSVSGTGVNDDRVPIEFSAFVLEGSAGNYAIAIFSARGADRRDMRSILDSFTTF